MIPAELVIDHSVIADVFARRDTFRVNADLEFARNQERYQLLPWASRPSTTSGSGGARVYPDTLVGTDSHTPMVNGLGVLGWGGRRHRGRGGHARPADEHAHPQAIGFKLIGELPEGATATDLVLTVAELLRRTGVVGKFVEFYGPGVASVYA